MIVAAQGGIGGGERVLLMLLSSLRAGEVVVCAPAGSDLARAVAAMGHPVHDLFLPKLRNSPSLLSYARSYLVALRNLVVLIRRERPSVLHGFASFTIKVVVPASFLTGVPVVVGVYEVTTASRIGRIRSLTQRALAARVSLILATSEYIADSLVASGYPASRVRAVHNGIMRDTPRLSRPSARERLGLPGDQLLVLVVARLSHWKGVHVALDAFARFCATNSVSSVLVVVGGPAETQDEHYRDGLVVQAAELGISGRVRFEGPRTDTDYFYDACDVVLVPSIEPDPFPTVVLEASLAGRPVLATSRGGAREAVIDGVTGLVVEPTPDAFAKALERASDPTWSAAAGAAARSHMERNFRVPDFAIATRAAWREAADGTAGIKRRRSPRTP